MVFLLRSDSTVTAAASVTQVEARCRQVQEQAEEREQQLGNQISSAEEERIQAENQVKDLKESIFELEDQVEQQRAISCHTNQAVLDMESMFLQPPPQGEAHSCFRVTHLLFVWLFF